MLSVTSDRHNVGARRLASQRVKLPAHRPPLRDKVCNHLVGGGRQCEGQAVDGAFQYRPPRIIERGRGASNSIEPGRFDLDMTPTNWLVFQRFKQLFALGSSPGGAT